jgi:hypothetical protein
MFIGFETKREAACRKGSTPPGVSAVLLLSGVLVLAGGCGGSSAAGPSGPGSTGADPYIVGLSLTGPSLVPQGDTTTFEVTWPDSAAGQTVVLWLTGLATGTQSLTIPAGSDGLKGSLAIPNSSPDGFITLHVTILNYPDTQQATVTIKDNVAPLIWNGGGWVVADPPMPAIMMNAGTASGVMFVGGTTDTMYVTATDNHDLAWIGWRLGAPANIGDSISPGGLSATLRLPMSITSALIGTTSPLTLFVRDADSNETDQSYGVTQVAQYVDHPAKSTSLDTRVTDVAFDAKRGVAYLAEPDSERIAVLSLGSMTWQSPIAVAGRVFSIDITPGGDSLLAALDTTNTIAIVNLASGRLVTTLVMPPAVETGASPMVDSLVWRVRVAQDDRALITLHSQIDNSSALEELNLLTDSIHLIVPPNVPPAGSSPTGVRSGDGSHVLLPNIAATPGSTVYSAGTHTYAFNAATWTAFNDPNDASLTSAADAPYTYLVSHNAYDATVTTYGVVGLGYDSYWGATMAPSGTDAYIAESLCNPPAGSLACTDTAAGVIFHYKLPTSLNPGSGFVGQLVDLGDAPKTAYQLWVSPDSKLLIGASAHTVMAFDLTQTTPPSGAVLARRVRAPGTRKLVVASGKQPAPSVAAKPTPSEITMRVLMTNDNGRHLKAAH